MPRTHAHTLPVPPLEVDFEYTTPGASTSTSPFTAAMHCPKRPSRSSTPPLARSAPTSSSSSSPLHFLYPASLNLLASKPGSASPTKTSKTKPQSKSASKAAADVSRLLDPAYLPSSARSNSASSAVGVYVDLAGDAHDPDYRHFPTVAPAGHSHGHKHSHSHGGYGQPQRRATSPRPQFDWERAVDESALDDEYPAEEEEEYRNHRATTTRPINIATTSSSAGSANYHRRSWSSSYGATTTAAGAARRPRESSFTTTATTTSASPAWYSPTGTASTLPTSYGSDALEVVPFDDEVKDEKELKEKDLKEKGEKRKRRRLSKGDKEKEKLQMKERERRSIDLNDHQPEHGLFAPFTTTVPRAPGSIFAPAPTSSAQVEDSQNNNLDPDDAEEDTVPAPTTANARSPSPCAPHTLRRQWQALALRLRFGLFHAQQRVRRRVGGLTGL